MYVVSVSEEIRFNSSHGFGVPGKTSKDAGSKVEELGGRPCSDCTMGAAGVDADGVEPDGVESSP